MAAPTNELPPLTRLIMIAEELDTAADAGAHLDPGKLGDMADVLCQVHAALAGPPAGVEYREDR